MVPEKTTKLLLFRLCWRKSGIIRYALYSCKSGIMYVCTSVYLKKKYHGPA